MGAQKELHCKTEKNLRTQHHSVPLCQNVRTDQDRNPRIQLQDGRPPLVASCKVIQVRTDGTVQVHVKQDCSCLEQTVRRNLAQFTGRCRARQTWRSWDHDGRTDCLERLAIIDDFIECEGSLAARSRTSAGDVSVSQTALASQAG